MTLSTLSLSGLKEPYTVNYANGFSLASLTNGTSTNQSLFWIKYSGIWASYRSSITNKKMDLLVRTKGPVRFWT